MSSPTANSVLNTGDLLAFRLDNGLQVLVRELRTSPTVSAMMWYRVGARNEREGGTGRSHFLEHMLFKGTEKYGKGEIDLLTVRNGGANNAFTSHDFTAYYFSFASDRWEIALEIEADRMIHTVFDPGEFESERRVVIEELKAGLDQPWGAFLRELNFRAYDRHPYRNPVIGWLPDIEAASIADMQEYYQQHYCPSNATLVLVGDVTRDEAVHSVERHFARLESGSAPRPIYEFEVPQSEERRFELEWPSQVPRIAVGCHAPAIAHADSYALQVLAVILGEGKTSRLYRRLVEGDQVATFVTAEYGEALDDTLFLIRAEGRSGTRLEGLEAAISDEIRRIAEDGVGQDELRRACSQIEANFIFSMERSLDQAMLLGQVQTLTSLDYIDTYLRRIQQVDETSIREVSQRYLARSNRTTGWLLPAKGGTSELGSQL